MIIQSKTRIVSVFLRRYCGGEHCGLGPDCFDDLETGFPLDHPDRLAGSNIIRADDEAIDNLLCYWSNEVQKANRGWDHTKYESFKECLENLSTDDLIFPLDDGELQRGDEWQLGILISALPAEGG